MKLQIYSVDLKIVDGIKIEKLNNVLRLFVSFQFNTKKCNEEFVEKARFGGLQQPFKTFVDQLFFLV